MFDLTKWLIKASERFDSCKYSCESNKCKAGCHPILDCADCISYEKKEKEEE